MSINPTAKTNSLGGVFATNEGNQPIENYWRIRSPEGPTTQSAFGMQPNEFMSLNPQVRSGMLEEVALKEEAANRAFQAQKQGIPSDIVRALNDPRFKMPSSITPSTNPLKGTVFEGMQYEPPTINEQSLSESDLVDLPSETIKSREKALGDIGYKYKAGKILRDSTMNKFGISAERFSELPTKIKEALLRKIYGR